MKLPKPYKFSGKGINTSHIGVYGVRSINENKSISTAIADPDKDQVWFLVCVSGVIVRRAKINRPGQIGFRPRRECWQRNILTDGKVFYNVVYGTTGKFVASRCFTRANYMNNNNRRAIVAAIDQWLSNNIG